MVVLLCRQGHHMVAALEERCSQEVLTHDEAIRLLKEENESLEAAKLHLSEEAKLLPTARVEIASMKKEKGELELSVAKLWKDLDGAEVAKELAILRATKAAKVSNRLCEDLEAERESATSLPIWLREVEAQASTIVGLYRDALRQFGGSTSAPPEGGDIAAILAWLKSHITKLPNVVGGAVDFGALVGVSSFAHLLRCGDSTHAEVVQKEKINSVAEIGEGSANVRRSVHNFISFFWAKFSQAEARGMAEARWLEVSYFWVFLVLLVIEFDLVGRRLRSGRQRLKQRASRLL